MPEGGEVREHVTLPGGIDEAALTALLAVPGGATLSVGSGTDAGGHPRTVLTLIHSDAEVVTLTRQNLLRACRERGVRAFVV